MKKEGEMNMGVGKIEFFSDPKIPEYEGVRLYGRETQEMESARIKFELEEIRKQIQDLAKAMNAPRPGTLKAWLSRRKEKQDTNFLIQLSTRLGKVERNLEKMNDEVRIISTALAASHQFLLEKKK